MRISEIQVPARFKNYEEMCERLGLTPRKAGGARASHLEDLKRQINIKRDGHAIIFKSVKPFISAKDMDYGELISHSLLKYLKEQFDLGEHTAYLSYSHAFSITNMVGSEYQKYKGNHKELEEIHGVPRDISKEFYDNVEKSLRGYLDGAMNKLFNYLLSIQVTKGTLLQKGIIEDKSVYSLATSKEEEIIEKCEKIAGEKTGYGIYFNALVSGAGGDFRNTVCSVIEEEYPEVGKLTGYHKGYRIDFDSMINAIDINTTDDVRKRINEETYIIQLDNAQNRNCSSLDMHEFVKRDKEKARSTDGYTENFKVLLSLLIKPL